MAQEPQLAELLKRATEQLKAGECHTLIPFLPLVLLNGKPFGLHNHFQTAPIYGLKRPKRFVFKTGRQTGKSQSISGSGYLSSALLPFFNTAFIQPRFSQIQDFSSTVLNPMHKSFMLRPFVWDSSCSDQVLFKTFKNGSVIRMSYCFLDPGRIRGMGNISALYIDEVQDILNDHLAVIQEISSASDYGFFIYTGTPKTSDNTLSALFENSSKAEWVMPCSGCGKLNVPSIHHDLIKMIQNKGCSCVKCGKLLNPRAGWYEHEVPHKRDTMVGYHISQVIHPLHQRPASWNELVYKFNTYTKLRFYNEVLGEPCDEAAKLITVSDLKNASNTFDNTKEMALAVRPGYETVVLGVDWGGGGASEMSRTALAVVGMKTGTDTLDTLYGECLPAGMPPEDELKYVLDMAYAFRVSFVAHDYASAGALREIMMEQAGLPSNQIIPFTYVHGCRNQVIQYNKTTSGNRRSYSIDKTQSLVILCNMIKGGRVTLPIYEKASGCVDDLLALMEEVREVPGRSDVRMITRLMNKPDDFAHALNLGCSCIWYIQDRYPTLVDAERYRISRESLALADPESINWNV